MGLLQQSAVLMQEGSEQQGHDDERDFRSRLLLFFLKIDKMNSGYTA